MIDEVLRRVFKRLLPSEFTRGRAGLDTAFKRGRAGGVLQEPHLSCIMYCKSLIYHVSCIASYFLTLTRPSSELRPLRVFSRQWGVVRIHRCGA